MQLTYQDTFDNVPWNEVPLLLEKVGMANTDVETHRISFEASRESVFVFDGNKLVGFGRAISDGVRQAALYDIAVDPDYQGYNIGRNIVERIIAKLPNCNFILYASPGKEGFYKKMDFKKMKTGMALFSNPQRMIDLDFVEE